jgi:hypothetical protein
MSDADPADANALNRREFSRLGMFVGGAALAAPSIRTLNFAGKIVGSAPPPTTQPPPQPTTTTSVGVTGTSVTTAPLATTTSTVGKTGTEQTSPTTDGAVADAERGQGGGGSLPLTGAAIGGAAVLGGAAIAVGRAMTRAQRTGPVDQSPDIGE